MSSFAAASLLAPAGGGTSFGLVAGALVVLGIVLLAIELLVIPGFGVVGVLGIAAIAGGGLVAWSKLGPLGGMLAFGAGIAAAAALLWAFKHSPIASSLVLGESHAGFRAHEGGLSALVGKDGVADTPLRPAGSATFGETRVDVVTDGVFVEAGTPVRVVGVEGMRVVVEAAPSNQGET
ncbi:MAG: NfeD family protein [Myxococcota bacterium]